MPYTPSQHRLFSWAATNPNAAKKEGYDIPQKSALRMMREGIKKDDKPKKSALKLGKTKE